MLPKDFKKQFQGLDFHVQLAFLHQVADKFADASFDFYKILKDVLQLDSGYNAEISFAWYQLSFKLNKPEVIPYVVSFLKSNGGLKYLKPLYTSLFSFDKELAINTLNSNKDFYHPDVLKIIGQDFEELANK